MPVVTTPSPRTAATPHERRAAPLVSVVVPCRDEGACIAPFLASLLAVDWPADRLEVLVVDGMSGDGTREAVAAVAARDARVRLLDNPARITPVALNVGIRAARGEVVMRLDAHTEVPRDYVRRLVTALQASGADNVGAVLETVPGGPGVMARAIAAALAHPLAVGNSHFRTGTREPRWVDTVPFGCWHRAHFARVGLFDEALVRNQDDEFNHRTLARGGKLLLLPDVRVRYVARDRLGKLARMMWQYGRFKPLVARKVGQVATVRQLVPAAFVAALVGGVALALAWPGAGVAALCALGATYGAVVGAAALAHARRAGVREGAALAVAIPAVHLAYGAGWWTGAAALLVRGAGAPPPALALTR